MKQKKKKVALKIDVEFTFDHDKDLITKALGVSEKLYDKCGKDILDLVMHKESNTVSELTEAIVHLLNESSPKAQKAMIGFLCGCFLRGIAKRKTELLTKTLLDGLLTKE